MRILVVSDSHGDELGLRLAIQAEPKARMMIHLGDGERDMDTVSQEIGNIKVMQLKGNVDSGSSAPEACVGTVEGKRIYCTHGDNSNPVDDAKNSTAKLKENARREEADIVLFGHTHEPINEYDDGLYIFNPGSIMDGHYGVVDINKDGIVCVHKKL